MTTPTPGGWRRDTAFFAAGAACGVLAGSFLVAALVWQYGNVIGTRADRAEPTAAAIARWEDGMDDAGTPIVEDGSRPESRGPVGTAATPSPEAVPTATMAPPADSPAELSDRALAIPVQGVTPDTLTRQFDDPRGASREHQAIDILAPRHTPVIAVEDGTIARLFLSKAGGTTIYQFDPSQRFCYYYAHLERYADGLREGEAVKKGQVIGYVGTSGNAPANTPHLHFAVFRLTDDKRWWEGTAIDPYDVLRR